MKKQWLPFIYIVIFIFLSFVIIPPLLYYKETTQIAKSVLLDWKMGNLPDTYQYWEDPQKSPPIYGLTSYKIIKKKFSKINGIKQVGIIVNLDFSEDNVSPSGKLWTFLFKKTKFGWKIVDFNLVNE